MVGVPIFLFVVDLKNAFLKVATRVFVCGF
jgi:hypothetical protein